MSTGDPMLVRQLQALADPYRLELLAVLADGPQASGELGWRVNLDSHTTIQHLGVLTDVGLVSPTVSGDDGSGPRYALDPQAIVAVNQALMLLATPPVISVVAKSGTGKTTFIEKLVPELKARGLQVGVLKHHSHATPFDVPGKDTYRHAQAGADVVVGACAVQVAIFRQENGSEDLHAVIAQHFAGMDLVLTEGYKRGSYPKIEVHRSTRSPELLCRTQELIALVTDRHWPLEVPQFSLDDAGGVADLLMLWLASRKESPS